MSEEFDYKKCDECHQNKQETVDIDLPDGTTVVCRECVEALVEQFQAEEAMMPQPEQKPLTREEISYGFRTNDADLDAESYWAGVRFAEVMHGIGGEPLSNEQKRLRAIAIKQREAHGIGGGE